MNRPYKPILVRKGFDHLAEQPRTMWGSQIHDHDSVLGLSISFFYCSIFAVLAAEGGTLEPTISRADPGYIDPVSTFFSYSGLVSQTPQLVMRVCLTGGGYSFL